MDIQAISCDESDVLVTDFMPSACLHSPDICPWLVVEPWGSPSIAGSPLSAVVCWP